MSDIRLEHLEKVRNWLVNLANYDFIQCHEYTSSPLNPDEIEILASQNGLCSHLMLMIDAVDCMANPVIDSGFYDEIATYWRENYIIYSGWRNFPVPPPYTCMNPCYAFDKLEKWKGKYGENRVLLVMCTIDFIDIKIKQLETLNVKQENKVT